MRSFSSRVPALNVLHRKTERVQSLVAMEVVMAVQRHVRGEYLKWIINISHELEIFWGIGDPTKE